jgi:hypothetical protein
VYFDIAPCPPLKLALGRKTASSIMGKRKRKLTAEEKAEKKRRKKEFMTYKRVYHKRW